VSGEKPAGRAELIAELLAYAETHAIDLVALLLALAWAEGAGGEAEGEPEPRDPMDVPAHYYPH
jgi:hypothetical protein